MTAQPSDWDPKDERFVQGLITGGGPHPSGSAERVARILGRARREVAMRDFITFIFGRIWAVILLVGAQLYAEFRKWQAGLKPPC